MSLGLATLEGHLGDDLALRNLRRGAALGLPSGQDVARALGVTPLPDDQLLPAAGGREPLWFYILREAQALAGGTHLGPEGGRIVGETVLGLLRADPRSYLQLEPTWTPRPPVASGGARDFQMADLLRYAVPDQAVRFLISAVLLPSPGPHPTAGATGTLPAAIGSCSATNCSF